VFLGLVNADLNHLLRSEISGRHEIRLEILSISIHFADDPSAAGVLLTEAMRARVFDRQTGRSFPGPTGLNFSSYLRDYDFRIVLPRLLQNQAGPVEWSGFGALHGLLTRRQFGPGGLIAEPLAIAISIADNHAYRATSNLHPILGREYGAEASSLTDQYFAQMGLRAQFFRPDILPAPLAIYSSKPLQQEGDYHLAALVAVMANFQRIYRPEIYMSRLGFSTIPEEVSRASLANSEADQPALNYNRQERELLADQQARFIERVLVKPHGEALQKLLPVGDGSRPSPAWPHLLDEPLPARHDVAS
jgi:hypothetical protein